MDPPLSDAAFMRQNGGDIWATIDPEEASPMARQISALGIDIVTRVCHIVGMDDRGHVVLRKRMARNKLLPFIAMLPPLGSGLAADLIAEGQQARMALVHPETAKAYADLRTFQSVLNPMATDALRALPLNTPDALAEQAAG